MWPFAKKYPLEALLQGWTDWHSHILPGVDDGVRTLDESLQALAYYEEKGVKQVWLTPHIMTEEANTTERLKERYKKLQAAYNGPVQLHLAAENMLDRLFGERLEEGDLLTLPEDCLLVETSYLNPPIDFWEILHRIRVKGYWPVLAHPERYVYMGEKDYRRLRKEDVQLQLNLPSLAGLYGPAVQKKAVWMLKNGFYGRSGSDLHRPGVTRTAFEKASVKKGILDLAQELVSVL